MSSKFQYEAIVRKGKGKGLGVCLLTFTKWLVYHGFEVIFNKGKAFLRHIATGQVKQIGVRVKNMYKLGVEECATLSTKAEKVKVMMSMNFGTKYLAICIMVPQILYNK